MPEVPSLEFLEFQDAVAGRYSLQCELRRGGMGIVFLAKDVALDRPVAIKLLPPELARQTDLRERFVREARTAARLSHPNIIPVFSVEEVGEFVFFVMAYVEGETLTERINSKGPFTVRRGVVGCGSTVQGRGWLEDEVPCRPRRQIAVEGLLSAGSIDCSVVAALVIAGFVACIVPARAATRADPLEAMRLADLRPPRRLSVLHRPSGRVSPYQNEVARVCNLRGGSRDLPNGHPTTREVARRVHDLGPVR